MTWYLNGYCTLLKMLSVKLSVKNCAKRKKKLMRVFHVYVKALCVSSLRT